MIADEDNNIGNREKGGGNEEATPVYAEGFPAAVASIDASSVCVGENSDTPNRSGSVLGSENPNARQAESHRRVSVAGSLSHVRTFFSNSVSSTNASDRKRVRSTSNVEKWVSIGSRRIRYASQVSDDNEEDRRGIVATPLDEELGKPMGMGARFLKKLQVAADDVGESGQFFIRRSSPCDDQADSLRENNENQMYRLQATRESEVGCLRVS